MGRGTRCVRIWIVVYPTPILALATDDHFSFPTSMTYTFYPMAPDSMDPAGPTSRLYLANRTQSSIRGG